MLLGGNLVDAVTALKYGLINYVTPAEDLESAVQKFASQLLIKNSSESMRLIKEMIANSGAMPLQEALDYAAKMNASARSTDDCRKGIEAFLNKESLMW